MQPVFKCEYCKFMGTEEEVKKHEAECVDNYDKRSCTTCKHRKTYCNPTWRYECENGIDIPEGKMFENCSSYERKEKVDYGNLFGGLFGGVI